MNGVRERWPKLSFHGLIVSLRIWSHRSDHPTLISPSSLYGRKVCGSSCPKRHIFPATIKGPEICMIMGLNILIYFVISPAVILYFKYKRWTGGRFLSSGKTGLSTTDHAHCVLHTLREAPALTWSHWACAHVLSELWRRALSSYDSVWDLWL